MKQKNDYWQVVRAICIIAVIAIHCPSALNRDNADYQFHLYMMMRSLVNFPVAVFLFLSGYFINQEKCLNDPKTYILKRGERLLIPYLFWSMVYIAVSAVSGDKIGLLTVIGHLLTGKAAAPLYYVVVLVQLTILAPLLISSTNMKRYWLWLLTPAALLITYAFAFRTGAVPWYCDTLFPLWFGFFYLGIRLRAGDLHIDSFLRKLGSIPCVLIAFVFNYAESELLLSCGITSELSVSQNRIGGFIYALTIIGLLYRLSENKKSYSKALVWLGDNSYAIYLTHYLVLKILNKVIGNKLLDIWILHFGIVFLTTTILTCLIIVTIKLCADKVKIHKYMRYIGY